MRVDFNVPLDAAARSPTTRASASRSRRCGRCASAARGCCSSRTSAVPKGPDPQWSLRPDRRPPRGPARRGRRARAGPGRRPRRRPRDAREHPLRAGRDEERPGARRAPRRARRRLRQRCVRLGAPRPRLDGGHRPSRRALRRGAALRARGADARTPARRARAPARGGARRRQGGRQDRRHQPLPRDRRHGAARRRDELPVLRGAGQADRALAVRRGRPRGGAHGARPAGQPRTGCACPSTS